MSQHLEREIESLLDSPVSEEVVLRFRQRLAEGGLAKTENPISHFCAYFAACDYKAKQLFIGHHIKSGLWLFNGGHVEEGENLRETVAREIGEEWGLNAADLSVSSPALLTITKINNPTKQTCRLHFDVWHFVNVDKNNFQPDPAKLAEEFHSAEWMDLAQARQMIIDPSTLKALDFIKANYFC